jgi:Pentapeptide repeats (8 copies)
MANEAHLARLKQGIRAWNSWQRGNNHVRPDLTDANLARMNLAGADLYETDLAGADLTGANLTKARLYGADLAGAKLTGANLTGAFLMGADLMMGDLTRANLTGAFLAETNLIMGNLTGADLTKADLSGANLTSANLTGANLTGASLARATLVEAKLDGTTLTGCTVYGIAAWNVRLAGARQSDLVITRHDEPVITVDNLEVAQFIYLLLHNEKIRQVIDTVTSKAVLILGRFTPERKPVLDAIREALRQRNYLPILFDFEGPQRRDFTETITTLAHLARFIIADLTEPSSLPKELEAIVPTLAVPVQPVLGGASRPYSMFQDYWKYHWVLKVYRYEALEGLIAALGDRVIAPAEAKVRELDETRKVIAEEILKQRPI